MEFRHLRGFVVLAGELHFGRAARRLHIAQPPLSRQVQQLEQELGVLLLRRSRRRVELTEAGRFFLEGARRTLAEAEQTVQAAQQAHTGRVGRLIIGFVPSAVMPPLLRAFRAGYPAVDLTLQQLTTARQVDALVERRIHVGLLRPPVVAPELVVEPISSEPLVAVLPAGHRLASRRRLSLRALANEPFVLFPRQEGAGLYDHIIAACRTAGFAPRVVQEANEMLSILSLIAGGLGVSLVPKSVATIRDGDLVFCPLRRPAPQVQMAIAWRADDQSPLVQAFIQFVRRMRRGFGATSARRRGHGAN